MSRNHKIRRQADKLPPYPKFTADKQVMRTPDGSIVYENHFNILNTLRRKPNGEKLILQYMGEVWLYNTYVKNEQKKLEKADRMGKLLNKLTLWVPVALLVALAIYFSLIK